MSDLAAQRVRDSVRHRLAEYIDYTFEGVRDPASFGCAFGEVIGFGRNFGDFGSWIGVIVDYS